MESNLDTELVSLRHSMDMVTVLILVQDQVLAREDVMQDVVQVCSSQNYLIETAKKVYMVKNNELKYSC